MSCAVWKMPLPRLLKEPASVLGTETAQGSIRHCISKGTRNRSFPLSRPELAQTPARRSQDLLQLFRGGWVPERGRKEGRPSLGVCLGKDMGPVSAPSQYLQGPLGPSLCNHYPIVQKRGEQGGKRGFSRLYQHIFLLLRKELWPGG